MTKKMKKGPKSTKKGKTKKYEKYCIEPNIHSNFNLVNTPCFEYTMEKDVVPYRP